MINDDVDKYCYVIRCLNDRQLETIHSRLPGEHHSSCHQLLRELLINIYSVPLGDRIRDIYNGGCSNLKPSEILRKLRSFFCPNDAPNTNQEFLKEMFFQQLPPDIVSALSAHPDDTIDILAYRADSIFARRSLQSADNISYKNHASNPDYSVDNSKNSFHVEFSSMMSKLANEVSNLRKELDNMKHNPTHWSSDAAPPTSLSSNALTQHPVRVRNGERTSLVNPSRALLLQNHQSSSSNNANYRNHRLNAPTVCWYHQRYGNLARNCVQPCAFSSRGPFFRLGRSKRSSQRHINSLNKPNSNSTI
ncbi:uncharacterized protein LOC144425188 [Styela clava]